MDDMKVSFCLYFEINDYLLNNIFIILIYSVNVLLMAIGMQHDYIGHNLRFIFKALRSFNSYLN